MKKWLGLTLMLVACSRGPAPGTSLTGAPTPRQAAVLFMNAVKAGDLQVMSTVWGTESGPIRDTIDRTQLDQRLIIMQGCYNHDRYEILDDSARPDGARTVRVRIERGGGFRVPGFIVVRGPSERWYVLDADFNTMRDFCAS